MKSPAVEGIDYDDERMNAYLDVHRTLNDKALADFDRTARVLAGKDETLRRVLAAAILDAYLRGYHQPTWEASAMGEWDRGQRTRSRYQNRQR